MSIRSWEDVTQEAALSLAETNIDLAKANKDLEAKIEKIKLENTGHYLELRRSESLIKELEKKLRKAHISEADAQEDAIFHRDRLSLHFIRVTELEAKLKVAVELLEEFDRIGECSLRKTREALEKIKAK